MWAPVGPSSRPERRPRLERLGDGAHPVVVLGPVGGRQGERVDAHLGAVPELVAAADEVPAPVAALVGVAVEDRLVDPALAVLDLALAVHVADGVIVVDE